MAKYISFPTSSGGNPRQLHPDFFVPSQNIQCGFEVSATGASNNPQSASASATLGSAPGVSLLDISDGAYTYINSSIMNRYITNLYTPTIGDANRSAEPYLFMTFGAVDKVTTINGITVDWNGGSNVSAMVDTIADLSQSDLQAHLDEIKSRIQQSIIQQLSNTFSVSKMASNQTSFTLDPEFRLLDTLYLNEICTYHIRVDGPISQPSLTFTNVSSNDVPNRGLFYTDSGYVAANASGVDGERRLEMFTSLFIDLVEFSKTQLGYSKVSFYRFFGLFQDDIARLSAGVQNAGNTNATVTQDIYQAILDNPKLQTLHAALYTNQAAFYPGSGIAARRDVFDICVEQLAAVFGEKASIWFDAYIQRGGFPDAGADIFEFDQTGSYPDAEWGGMAAEYRVGDYTVDESDIIGNYPSASGVLAYQAQKIMDSGAKGLFLFPFSVNSSIATTGELPDSFLETFNNGPDQVAGEEFQANDVELYFNWYFNLLLGDFLS